MKIKLIATGKTSEHYLRTGITDYRGRLKHFIDLEWIEIPEIRCTASTPVTDQLAAEAERIRKHVRPGDTIVLLDERGREMRSAEFADFLNQKFVSGGKTLVFIIGGPFGFSESLRKEAGFLFSLSRMTFSHQMVRLIFVEQLYRAMTILRKMPYHHE